MAELKAYILSNGTRTYSGQGSYTADILEVPQPGYIRKAYLSVVSDCRGMDVSVFPVDGIISPQGSICALVEAHSFRGQNGSDDGTGEPGQQAENGWASSWYAEMERDFGPDCIKTSALVINPTTGNVTVYLEIWVSEEP
jgi:hypothetical protein